MQSICCANEQAPPVAEKSTIASTARGPRSEIGNDDDVEFQTLRLMDGEYSNHIVELGNNLGFRFANRCVLGAVAQITYDIVQRSCSLPRKNSGDLDQLADVGHPLRSIPLRHQNDVEVCFPNHI